MGVKYNHTEFEQETNGGGRERVLQVADPGFKIRRKWPKNAFFWHLRVPVRSLERGIGRGKNIHNMNNHLWSLSSGFNTQVVRPTTCLWVQNTAKSALKSTLFAYFFMLHVVVTSFLAMNCTGHPCGAE